MRRLFQPQPLAVGLAHFLIVLLFLHAGAQWGYTNGLLALVFHTLLFPGWLVYLVVMPDTVAGLLIAYPLNSALWGFGVTWLWRHLRRRIGSRRIGS